MEYRNCHFAIELMKTGLLFLQNAKLRSLSIDLRDDPFRSLLLYCIRQVKPGLWLPLNRDYNVLGLTRCGWSDYNSDLYNHMLIKTEDINFDLLWDNDWNQETSDNYFIFSDSTSPIYYYKKTQETMKNWIRYESVISNSFLGKNTGKDFEYAWGYKKTMTNSIKSYQMQKAIQQSKEGRVKSRGSFAKYIEDDELMKKLAER